MQASGRSVPARGWPWPHVSAKLRTTMRGRFRQLLAVGSVVATTAGSFTIVASAQAGPLPPPAPGPTADVAGTGATLGRSAAGTATGDSVTEAVDGTNGVSVLARQSFAWSAPVNTNMGLVSVSCASASFCMGLAFGGAAYTYDGRSWSEPVQAISTEGVDVSCASGTFCAAGNVSGEVVIYNGRSWSSAQKVGSQGTISLSCPSRLFCMSMGYGYFAAYNGKKWSPSRTLGFNVVSCASALFCVAAGGGRAVVFDGTTWSDRESDHLLDVQSISCPSVRFCMAGSSGAVAIYDGKSWSRLQVADAYQVSCASKSFCVTVSPMGEADTYNGRTWSAPSDLDPRLASMYMDEAPPAVSCPSSKFCMVVDGYGYITGRATGRKAARPGRREPAKGIPDGENLEGHASQWDNLGLPRGPD